MGQYMNYNLLVDNNQEIYNNSVNQYNSATQSFYVLITILVFVFIIFLLIAGLM